MKEITETALEHLLLAHPGAEIVEKGAGRIVRIPMYDIENDRAWTEERKIVKDPEATRLGILPVFPVRTGAKFNPKGDVKQSPLGHFYRIIGYTPPPKKDDE